MKNLKTKLKLWIDFCVSLLKTHLAEVLFEHEQEASFSLLKLANLIVGMIEPDHDSDIDDHKYARERHERPEISPSGVWFVVVPRGCYYAVPRALETHKKDAYDCIPVERCEIGHRGK